jgi:hypothetical protein
MVRVMIAQLKHRLFAISESVRSGVHCKVKTVVHGSDVYEESDDSSAQTCGESARREYRERCNRLESARKKMGRRVMRETGWIGAVRVTRPKHTHSLCSPNCQP